MTLQVHFRFNSGAVRPRIIENLEQFRRDRYSRTRKPEQHSGL